MRIVVTGGAGFLGGHLCKRLLDEGNEVVCIDNFITGSHKNIQAFSAHPSFHLIEHDLTLPFKEDLGEIDQIYHLASPCSPQDFVQLPLHILWTNAAGTKTVLELASKKAAALVLTSSSAIYGSNHSNPIKESDYGRVNPVGEMNIYAESKRFAESMAMMYYRDFRFPFTLVRLFNTYGPHMPAQDHRVIPDFIKAALFDEPLRVHGDGTQLRSFCYVDDAIEGLLLAMKAQAIGPINLGSQQPISLNQLAQTIIQVSDSSSMISHIPLPREESHRVVPDITLAREKLGFESKISLEEGLKRTIDSIKLAT